MAKKKNSKKRAKSDDENEGCDHVYKAVRLASINNTLSHMKIGNCDKCQSSSDAGVKESVEATKDESVSTCICLRCSFQGCSRGSKNQHALAHYKEFPSHPLNINIKSWVIWCYDCDNEVPIGLEKHALFKAVKFIRKHVNGTEPCPSSAIQSTAKSSEKPSEATNVTGLSNLGNTCFFNAVIQNITQTTGVMEALKTAMLEESKAVIHKINKDKPPVVLNVKTPAGSLTSALFALVKDFQNSKQRSISPGKLFGEVCKKAPMFRGFQQQDSQELFHYILDGIRSEELTRVESALKSKAKELSIEKKKIPDILRQHKTFIDDLFSGILVSSVVCSTCKEISQTFDRFFDLSLPIVTVPQDTKVHQAQATNKRPQKLLAKANMSKHQRKMNAKKERKQKGRRGRSRTISRTESESTEVATEAINEPDEGGESKQEEDQISVFEEVAVDEPDKYKQHTTKYIDVHSYIVCKSGSESDPYQQEISTKPDFETSTSYVDIQVDNSVMNDTEIPNSLENDSKADNLISNDRTNDSADTKGTEDGGSKDDESATHILPPEDTNLKFESTNVKRNEHNVNDRKNSTEVCPTVDNDNKSLVNENDTMDNTENDTKGKVKGGELKSNSESSKFNGAIALLCKGVLEVVLDLKENDINALNASKESIENNQEEKKDVEQQKKEADEPKQNGIDHSDSENDDNDDDDDNVDEANEETEEVIEPEIPLLQPGECSISSSMHDFFTIDYLTGNNKFSCEHCAGGGSSSDSSSESTKRKPVFRDATKQFSISTPPNTLVLHLKRFAQTGRCFRKLNKHVDFKLTLDISRYCTPAKDGKLPNAIYQLYGIVEHSGSLNGGHYVAYIRNNATSKWYYISDSHVSEIAEAGVLRKQAYMLFYRRITTSKQQ